MGVVGNCVRRRRAASGLQQQALAARVGISRQSLSALEAGASAPSAAVALRLARALGCRVEELFWVDDGQAPIDAELAQAAQAGARVALASVGGRWVAHPLTASGPSSFLTAADGLVAGKGPGQRRGARATATTTATATAAATVTARIRPLGDAGSAREALACAGCAPAFGILAARASRAPAGGGADRHDRILWLERSSGEALDLLARGLLHVAGAHLYDEESGEFNVPFVRRLVPGRSMLVFNLARWEAGLVVAAGNPRRIRGVRDLARPGVSLVRRQLGSAAEDLLQRLLRREGLPARRPARGGVIAAGHMEVGRLVALGVADAGIALPAVARAHGLGFVPLAEERFDLVVARELADDARVVRLLETLGSRGFRREMESLGGHEARDAGKLVGQTSAAA